MQELRSHEHVAGAPEPLGARQSPEPPGATEAQVSDDQWRSRLGADRYQVLRRAATEPPWSGEYVRH
ncbi:MAG: hypothetical protein ACRDZX_00290, partial [Acidimicrobiales bacterium]